MRIAFLSYQWPGLRMGGIGSYVRQSAAALAMAGHEAHVFTIGDGAASLDNVPPGVTVHLVADPARLVIDGKLNPQLAAAINAGGESIYRLAIAWLLTAEFQKVHSHNRFDLIEVADVDATGLPLLLNAHRDVPVVVHLHTCTAIARQINSVGAVSARQQQIEAMESAQIHLADGICAPTYAVIESTQKIVPLDRQASVIPHPYLADRSDFSPPPMNGPVVMVGRIEWRKGCGVLSTVLNDFLKQNPTASFRFIGPDTNSAPGGRSMRGYIEERIDAEVKHRVEFTGEMSLSEVQSAVRQSSFCVLPSLSENFSLALCESMGLGRMTIIAAETGSVEVVGEESLIVDPNDPTSLLTAMNSAYQDRSRLTDLSRYAIDRVRTLCDPIAVSNQRVGFYKSVVSSFGKRTDRMLTLPPEIAGALLPCLSGITASLVNVEAEVDSPGQRLGHICKTFSQSASHPARVLLYGAGKHTERLLSERHVWESAGHRVVGLIDDHPRFAMAPSYMGLPVSPISHVDVKSLGDSTCMVLSTDTYEDQFWEKTANLRAQGLRVFRLYTK